MKIGIIGSLCNNRESASGQAVRTTILYNALCNKYGKDIIYSVNTHGFRSNPVRVLFETMVCILKCNHIIVMVHENGRKIFFPILYCAKQILGNNVYHNVIGGSFKEYLESNPGLIKYSKGFNINWVQMNSQIDNLKKIGIDNVELLPNTKENRILKEEELIEYKNKIYVFCMCSRISLAKGTEKAIEAIENINKEYGQTIVKLNIYGKPDSDYEERFAEVMDKTSDAINYCGFIPNNETVENLKNHYMLLFPSTYPGEGFPGTIWDAFAAGIPIIATNWRYNAEIVEHGKTGIIYNYKDNEALKKSIIWAIENQTIINKMKKNCIHEAIKYSPERVFNVIYKYLY